MRITNQIMQNNSLSNINRNKILQDKLNTQMVTHKKLTKASDDPVVAIRALRLRTTLSEITQYVEKNVPDARSWLSVTDGALDEVANVLENLYDQCNKGATDGGMTTESRAAILKSMKSYRDQIYATADADFAGRSVFTGYRTNSKATIQNNNNQAYQITEQLSRDDISKLTYVFSDDLLKANSDNYASLTATEQTVKPVEIYRMRLAYENLNGAAAQTPQITDCDGNPIPLNAGPPPVNITVTTKSLSGANNPYLNIGADDAVFVPETGELLLGENVQKKLSSMTDSAATTNKNEGEIRITYTKDDWKKGDLSPINYFACSTTQNGNPVNYNPEYLTTGKQDQNIEYDVGFNQTLRVNTTLDQVFDHAIGRDVDEMIQALEDMSAMEKVVKTLKTVSESNPADQVAKDKLAAAEKALTHLESKVKDMFGKGLTNMQTYQDKVNVAVADSGTRGARLDLIENRLETQQTTFDTLASENENIDLTKVTIELGSAELAYEAALLATGKLSQVSLLNYI